MSNQITHKKNSFSQCTVKFLFFFFILCTVVNCVLTTSENLIECVVHLRNHFDSKLSSSYQIVVIYDNDLPNRTISTINNELLESLQLYMPTIIFKPILPHYYLFDQKQKINIYPKTTFIIIATNTSSIKRVIDTLYQQLWSSREQSILLICISHECDNSVLEYAWSKKFLDLTMMQIVNFFTNKSTKLFLKSASHNASIHQYNPFQKVHSSFNCNRNIELFPNFIKNLHGFTLRVDMINEPPYVNLLRDSKGSVTNIVGSQLNLLKYIAKGMNFQIHFVQRTDDEKNNLLTEIRRDDFFKELKKGKADLIANERIYSSEVLRDFEFTKPITYSQFCAVVPILTKSHEDHFNMHQFLQLSVCLIAAILMNFVMRILDFERTFWKIIVMLQFIFGQSCKSELPKRVAEKIICFFTIIVSVIFFFQIFMSIIEHRLDLKEAKFKNLVDLLEYSFTIQADYEELLIKDRYLSITDKDREHHNLDIDDWKSRENCLERVVLQKNTICLMIESTGRLVEHASEVLYGKKVMKLMKDCPWKLTTRLVLAKGSPYLQKVNEIIQYMHASGIRQTFYLEDRSNMNLKNLSRVIESTNFHLDYKDVLLYFKCALMVLTIALIALILELIWNA